VAPPSHCPCAQTGCCGQTRQERKRRETHTFAAAHHGASFEVLAPDVDTAAKTVPWLHSGRVPLQPQNYATYFLYTPRTPPPPHTHTPLLASLEPCEELHNSGISQGPLVHCRRPNAPRYPFLNNTRKHHSLPLAVPDSPRQQFQRKLAQHPAAYASSHVYLLHPPLPPTALGWRYLSHVYRPLAAGILNPILV
jgi:hypothetical protein